MRFSRRLRTRALGLTGIVAAVAAGLAGCSANAGTGLWARGVDPVVLTGSQLPSFATTLAGDLVAFRYHGQAGAWDQVPVQVDQRHLEFLTKLRDGAGSTGAKALAYSDPAAYAGADPVGTIDADDEVAFMADDSGGDAPAGAGYPAGVVAGTGRRVQVSDPLAAGAGGSRGSGVGYIYLFKRSGSLSPAAGADYVDYDFVPSDPIGHAEDSTVSSDRYSTHFAARWVRDGLRLGTGDDIGPDILDRHRNLFAPGVCGRSEDTFSSADGGYASNIDGPVRVIRSYLGANSGTYTQREHVFYRQTERVQTFLRVHPIPGIMDFYDYSADAVGMRYSSSTTPGGVKIDGEPDTVSAVAPTWEAVTGSQGGLVSTSTLRTNLTPLTIQAYYSDDSTPPDVQCTGDPFEYGASGTRITSAIPNTDPAFDTPANFTATRWNVYTPAGQSAKVSQQVANLSSPLATTITAY